jgi:short-subunit dehydrogenase
MDVPDRIIISGVSGGLGSALAEQLPSDKVFGISRQINPDKNYKQFICDISDYDLTEELLRDLRFSREQKVAIVLTAGTLGRSGGIIDSDITDWEKIMRVNLFGNLAIIRAFLPNILYSGYGRIVFVAGGGAAYAYPKFSGYALSKVAIVREVENIAEEMKDKVDNFSIIALAPGAMETKMLKMVKFLGGEVKTTVDINEPVKFIKDFILMDSEKAKKLSGKFVHVRDDLTSEDFKNKWKLRRIE